MFSDSHLLCIIELTWFCLIARKHNIIFLRLERAQEEKRNVAEEKQNLEEKMRDEIMGAQEEANRLHELRQGAVSELSRLRYAEEELEQVDTLRTIQLELQHFKQ